MGQKQLLSPKASVTIWWLIQHHISNPKGTFLEQNSHL